MWKNREDWEEHKAEILGTPSSRAKEWEEILTIFQECYLRIQKANLKIKGVHDDKTAESYLKAKKKILELIKTEQASGCRPHKERIRTSGNTEQTNLIELLTMMGATEIKKSATPPSTNTLF